MALVRRGVKRVNAPEKEDVVCAVCRTPKTFKGFDALLIHAERFMKENARQHRGYFRALKEALQDEDDLESGKKCHRDFRPKDVVEAAPACCSASSPGQAGISHVPCAFFHFLLGERKYASCRQHVPTYAVIRVVVL